MAKVVIKGGKVHFAYDDKLRPLMGLGQAQIRRASHVEPTPDGRWTADMGPVQPGVVLGPFDTRTQALAEEKKWLEEHHLGVTA